MAQGAAARGEQPDPQFVVGGPAAAEHGEPGEGVDGHDADLVGPPVADGPEGIRVAPQELGADGMHAAAVGVADGPDGTGRAETRGDTAPTHQPAHRRLHSLWTS